MRLIDEAVADGARLKPACHTVEISFKSYLRWRSGKFVDLRKGAAKTVPRKLSEEEIEIFYQTANEVRFRDMTPEQIVAILAEEGIWLGSARTLYRILKKKQALVPRSESKSGTGTRKPPELTATGPNQVWSWDMTWLKSKVSGLFYFAYVIIDIFSRKIVGWSIEDREDAELAQKLFRRVIRDLRVVPEFVHADNGGAMKGYTLVSFLYALNIGLTYSRPRVSDDNPFIESFFKTLKYNVGYPKHFSDETAARQWFARFIHWYNTEHRHSGIEYVTPEQRHSGDHLEILAKRQQTVQLAAQRNPQRFVRGPRRFDPLLAVTLNKAS